MNKIGNDVIIFWQGGFLVGSANKIGYETGKKSSQLNRRMFCFLKFLVPHQYLDALTKQCHIFI